MSEAKQEQDERREDRNRMSEGKTGTWTVPESPITVEYSLVVIDEIRRAVTEGYQRLSRGGIEVGGLLYGVRDGETIRLTATRPIACEHARGPGFQLSDNDRRALTAQLKYTDEDPPLKDLVCLGLYVSHTRTGIQLSESDLEIYNSFFPESYQVTLVVRPGRGLSMRAGFFIREFDGKLRTEASYQEFNFPDRAPSILERRPAPEVSQLPSGPRERPAITSTDMRLDTGLSTATVPREYPARDYPTPRAEPEIPAAYDQTPYEEESESGPKFGEGRNGKKWGWLVAWFAVLMIVAVGAWRFLSPEQQAEPIGLGLAEKDGTIQVQWNRASRPIADAVRGSLDVIDGTQKRSVSLSKADLASGSFLYQRSSGDVEVRLSLESPNGSKAQEISRYLGQAPSAVKPDQAADLEKQRADLQREVDRLRGENASQNARIQQLERTVRILQTRLGQK